MKNPGRYIALCLLLVLGSCGGHTSTPQALNDVPLVPLNGSTTAGVTSRLSSTVVTVSFNAVAGSRFFTLDLPAGTYAQTWSWTGQLERALTVAAPTAGDLAVGVVLLGSASSAQLTLTVTTGSTPLPAAPTDTIGAHRFSVAAAAAGQVLLAWTQQLPGDYDFDGAVSLVDLTALNAGWGQHIDRTQAGADLQTAYWLDSNASGTVDAGDVTAIGRNLGLQVAGYGVLRNGTALAGSGAGELLVAAADGAPRAGLPLTFSLTTAGAAGDSWAVIPVNSTGASLGGAFTGGGNLTVDLALAGSSLVELDASGSKLSARVIDPIEVNDGIALALPTTVTGTTVSITNVPVGTVLLAQLTYKPTVSVGTSSAAVTTSVAFEIPTGSSDVAIDADLALTANASGSGYSLVLSTSTSADGSAAVDSSASLNFATGQLRRDTNYDGDLDNDLPFPDSDRDGISDPMLAELQAQHAPLDGAAPVHIAGRVQALDLAHGRLTLSEVQVLDGGPALPSTLTIHCAENMRFAPPPPPPPGGGGQNPPPGGQHPPPPPPDGDSPPVKLGDMLEAGVFTVQLASGSTAYWAQSMHPLGGPGAPQQSAITLQPQGDGSIMVHWTGSASYTGYRLQRYSTLFDGDGPGGPLNVCAPNDNLDWSQDLAAGTTQYHDTATSPAQRYTYELFGLSASGEAVYLGMTRPPPPPGG